MNIIKPFILGFALSSFPMWHPPAAAQELAIPDATEENVRELQQQLVDTLKQAFEAALEQYSHGQTGYSTVRITQSEMFDAQLEMAESRDKRISLHASQLKVAKKSLALAEARHKAGQSGVVDVYQAKAATLRIQIQLTRLQGRVRAENVN